MESIMKRLLTLREKSFITHAGVSMLGISDAADSIGFRTIGVKFTLEQLFAIQLPCILHWNQNHFVVLYKIKNNKFYISDPAGSKYTLDKEGFLKCWASTGSQGEKIGMALLLEPTPDFYTQIIENEQNEKKISFFFRYLRPFRSQILQLFVGLIIGSILSLIFPFLTQSIVDKL